MNLKVGSTFVFKVQIKDKLIIKKFKCLIGVSDHTLGSVVPVTSISHGAVMIEKHLKFNDKYKKLKTILYSCLKDLLKVKFSKTIFSLDLLD